MASQEMQAVSVPAFCFCSFWLPFPLRPCFSFPFSATPHHRLFSSSLVSLSVVSLLLRSSGGCFEFPHSCAKKDCKILVLSQLLSSSPLLLCHVRAGFAKLHRAIASDDPLRVGRKKHSFSICRSCGVSSPPPPPKFNVATFFSWALQKRVFIFRCSPPIGERSTLKLGGKGVLVSSCTPKIKRVFFSPDPEWNIARDRHPLATWQRQQRSNIEIGAAGGGDDN